jgi:hypothetical protein
MKLSYGLGLAVVVCLGAAVGCDDDRNLADLGAGGLAEEAGGASAAAGSPETSGGSDASAGQSAGGQGGAGPNECPTDFIEADGEPCSQEGQFCSDGVEDPCSFGNSLRCFGGVWERQEAFPAPCGGAGAGGAGGAAGADVGGAGGAGGAQ